MLNDKTSLGIVADVVMGQSPPSHTVNDLGQGVPFLQGNAEFTDLHPRARLWCRAPTRLAKSGDILLSVRAPVGALNISDRDYCIGRGLAAIRFKNADAAFGFYALQKYVSSLKKVAQGTTFEAVRANDVRDMVLYIPALSEQRRIAAILDTIDDAIRKTEQVIAKLERMKRGLLHDLLTRGIDENGELRDPERNPEQFKDSPLGRVPKSWETLTIGSLAVHVGSGLTPRGGSDVYRSQGVTFIRSQNVAFEGLKLDEVVYIDSMTHRSMSRSEIFAYDVLINITGASIGRCCWVPEGLGPANVNQHVCAIRLAEPNLTDAIFLSSVLSSRIGQTQIERLNAGSNREGLNYQQLRAFRIPWPTAKERALISRTIQQHDARVQEETRYLDKLSTLKQGLMDDLLTGRVRVRVDRGANSAISSEEASAQPVALSAKGEAAR